MFCLLTLVFSSQVGHAVLQVHSFTWKEPIENQLTDLEIQLPLLLAI